MLTRDQVAALRERLKAYVATAKPGCVVVEIAFQDFMAIDGVIDAHLALLDAGSRDARAVALSLIEDARDLAADGMDDADVDATIAHTIERALIAHAAAERERAAKIADAHGETIGEGCWNHENTDAATMTCSEQIAAAIRREGGGASL